MAQNFTDNSFSPDDVWNGDLQALENNDLCLKSSFSGTSAPANPVGGMPWHDSTARKIRNYANGAWLASLMGDASQKMWVYRNNTCEGWLIDATVTDRVLSIKGGGAAYNVNGGNGAGTWQQPNHVHTMAHTHPMPHTHTTSHKHPPHSESLSGPGDNFTFYDGTDDAVSGQPSNANTGSNSTANTGGKATVNTYRPAAAVGTLQYPNLT